MVGSTQPTWEVRLGFVVVGVCRAGGEAEGDGGGLLANTGLNREGTHLKGPVTIFLVLVSHSEGARQAGRECGGWWSTGENGHDR